MEEEKKELNEEVLKELLRPITEEEIRRANLVIEEGIEHKSSHYSEECRKFLEESKGKPSKFYLEIVGVCLAMFNFKELDTILEVMKQLLRITAMKEISKIIKRWE